MLAKAERPVIIAGDAVAQSRAHKELAALAEAIGAPVYVEFIPNTASFPASHPLYRGSMTRSQAGVREVLDKHDLLFSVGGDLFTWSLPSPIDPWPKGLPLIHLDTDRVADRQELSGAGRDPRRSQGDAAGHYRGCHRAHERRRQERRARRGSHPSARPTKRSARRFAPRRARFQARRRSRRSRFSRRSARCCRRTPW